jgi:hypothetical protein
MTPRWNREYGRSFSMTRTRRIVAISIACVGIAVMAAAGLRAAFQISVPASSELSEMLPQGALLTIESKDFAGVLKRWNGSAEKAAWLKSDNYSGFSRSRLFGRLGDAQTEFAQSAGLPPDMNFVNEVAGSESVFAWYDIGKLEFLYITRMPSDNASKTRLVQMRSKFSTRQVAGQTFYVRTQAAGDAPDPGGADDASGNSSENSRTAPPGRQTRTVAFATSGDWLLLATREDLMAGALTLLAAKSGATRGSQGPDPLSKEPWFVDARAAAAKEPGELRMTLNLEKIVPTPYFRSYWIQRNVSEMKQYRSAVADLYLQADNFREERVLLPKSSRDGDASSPDLGALVALLPQHTGVYRAVAEPTVDAVIGSLNEKLIAHSSGAYTDMREAPAADVTVHEVGSAADLETRIDDAPLARPARGAELAALRRSLAAADLRSMMTVSRTGDSGSAGGAASGIWVPFQSTVVLSASKDWDAVAMQDALQQAMQAHLTASGLGLKWKPVKTKTASYFVISDTQPLAMAVRGKLLILADDPGLMQEMLGKMSQAAAGAKHGALANSETPQAQATLIAGFDLPQERNSFARWSGLVDRTNGTTVNGASVSAESSGAQPSFFSQDMRGLGDVFAALESERVVERRDGAVTRQTVTYAWHR